MTEEDEIRRAERARQLLGDDLLMEGFSVM